MMRQHPRIFAGLLIGSLIINVFLSGLLIGFYWRNDSNVHLTHTETELTPSRPLRSMQWVQEALPENQAKIESVFVRHLQAVKPDLYRLNRLHKDIRHDLSAENLDVNSLSQRLKASRQTQTEIQGRIHKALLEAISQLSMEERQSLARNRGLGLGQLQRSRIIPSRDKDGDGKISRAEFLQAVPEQRREKAAYRFEQLDTNQDNVLTQQEWQRRH